MDVPASIPPPSAPAPPSTPAEPRRAPVGDLKKLDGRRVLARLIDAVIVGVPTAVAVATQDEGAYLVFLALSLIYFFVCEATLGQTIGKRVMGLRVMTRDGCAPSVNAVSVRTVLRLIDDGPLGLLVMVASGKRRQRIGDMLAGTAVGEAGAEVPRPLSSPLLVVYPVGWLIGAFVWLALPTANAAEVYKEQAQAICNATAPQSDLAEDLRRIEGEYAAHVALTPPPELASVHAELLRAERASLATGHEYAAARQAGNEAAMDAATKAEEANLRQLDRIVSPYMPGCVYETS
jgi:uncharacterized RDD family membrane protein YckC